MRLVVSFFWKIKDAISPVSRRFIKRELKKIDQKINQKIDQKVIQKLDAILKKESMLDNIWQINDIRFFVPNYPLDVIQRTIVDTERFYEQNILEDLSEFISKDSVICDIGANIGNHTLYWLSHINPRFVYCFEPRQETFQILERNIKINGFSDKVKCINVALSNNDIKLSTQKFEIYNIGGNSYCANQSGNIMAQSLDNIIIDRHIDFMKIDVEGMEVTVLEGAKNTIKKHLPVIFIESFEAKHKEVKKILNELGYFLKKEYPDSNYLYFPTK